MCPKSAIPWECNVKRKKNLFSFVFDNYVENIYN